jgi:hypothetical protein
LARKNFHLAVGCLVFVGINAANIVVNAQDSEFRVRIVGMI